jgi:dTDP-4-dehydrorhamnose reductase
MMNKKKILIIGASSKIGLNITTILKNKFLSNFEVFGTYNSQKISQFDKLDIINHEMIEKIFLKIKPNFVILTAALIRPITCEENKTLAWKTNVDSVKKIVEECKKINSKLIFLSSDYVYSGKDSIIEETETLKPLNYYGKTKLEGENIVSTLQKFLIIRTAWVNDVNPNSKSFVIQVINALKKNEIIDVPIDQFGHPTYSTNLAEIIIELILKDANGVFHITGSTYISRFDFAKKIAKAFCLNPDLIHGIRTPSNSLIQRPLKINLNLNKLKSIITTNPLTLDEQLNLMRTDYEFETLLDNVKLISIGKYDDNRGSLSVLISKNRNDAPNSENIQEVYLTEIPDSHTIRASHKHKDADEFFIMLNGSAKFVLIDDRKNSSTYKKSYSIFLNGEFRSALFVPSGIFHIFKTTENHSKCLAVSSKAYDKNNPDVISVKNNFFGKEFELNIS